jgi:O-antigen ligase
VVLDLLCCLPALLVLLRRVCDKGYIVRITLAEALLGLFAIWALSSTLWSANKADALVLSSHVVAAAAMFWAAAQLVRSWSRLRLVAGICMGLLLIYIVQGLMYRLVDVPDTIKYWKTNRAEEMRAHGWQEGDFALQQYEQKLMRGEMVIFQTSPNTLAATVVLISVVIAGVGIQRIFNRDESGVIGATLLPLPAAGWIIWCTHSNTAFVTPMIAAGILFLGGSQLNGWLNRKRKLTYALGIGAVVFGTLAVVGHGMFHGSLPSASLNFRWRYWVAAAQMFQAHPLLGVGYGNFGDAYLAVRSAAASEEIKDPHNLVVRAATELGIVGAVLLIAWLARVWWEWTNPVIPSPTQTKPSTTRRTFATIASISILGTLLKILAGVDFSSDPSWVTFELLKHLLFAALQLIGLALVVIKSTKQTIIDDRPAPWLLYAMIAGLAVFLIHNTIDFSLFEIGPMMLFTLIGGAVLGIRSPSAAGQHKRTAVAIGAFSVCLVAWVVAWIFVAVPLVQAENRAHDGDEAFRKRNFLAASEDYRTALSTAPVADPDYAMRAARALAVLPDMDGATRAQLILAIAANPRDPMGYLTRARYNLERHPDLKDEIRKDFERALELNPHDIDTRLEFAKVLEGFGDIQAVCEQYRMALKTNEGFDATEPKRLSEEKVKEIQAKIQTGSLK